MDTNEEREEPAVIDTDEQTTELTAEQTEQPRKQAKERRTGRRGTRPGAGRRAGAGLSMLDESGAVIHVAPAPVTESLRYMVARLRLLDGGVPRRLGVVSALSGEGVTSICRSLALLLANDAGKRICIVDLNWDSPSPWPADSDQGGGFAALLRGELSLDAALRPTATDHLSVLPAGSAEPGERPVLAGSLRLQQVLLTLEARFDHVLVDLPAIHATSEALRLAEHAGPLVVVVHQAVTPENQVKAALDELRGLPVLGVILNRSSSRVPRPILRRLSGA